MGIKYDLNKRLYTQVEGSTTETLDYVPAAGEKILFVNFGCSSSAVPSTAACVVWDPDGTPEVLISSYSEIIHVNVGIEKLGDGVKIVRICLTNDLTEPASMGAFWQAEILQ